MYRVSWSTSSWSIKVSQYQARGEAAFIVYSYSIWPRKMHNYFLARWGNYNARSQIKHASVNCVLKCVPDLILLFDLAFSRTGPLYKLMWDAHKVRPCFLKPHPHLNEPANDAGWMEWIPHFCILERGSLFADALNEAVSKLMTNAFSLEYHLETDSVRSDSSCSTNGRIWFALPPRDIHIYMFANALLPHLLPSALWLCNITNDTWTAITDKYIESNAIRWRQHLRDIWAIGIKLSVIMDIYTYCVILIKNLPLFNITICLPFYTLLFHSLFEVEFDINHFVLGEHRER